MSEIRTIGVLTSGGDAPGMNAAVRAVVRTGIYYGFKVLGIRKGYEGLLNGDMEEMTLRSVGDLIHRGGTILQTARSAEFNTEAGVKKAIQIAKVFGIDADNNRRRRFFPRSKGPGQPGLYNDMHTRNN